MAGKNETKKERETQGARRRRRGEDRTRNRAQTEGSCGNLAVKILARRRCRSSMQFDDGWVLVGKRDARAISKRCGASLNMPAMPLVK
jgi:hypothetical protein